MNTTRTAGARTHRRWFHRINSPLRAAAMVLSAALNGSVTPGGVRLGRERDVSSSDEDFDAAIALYRHGHWEQAYEMLARLADLGDAPASKLALLMLRYGAPLHGSRFAATPQQVARWARQVLSAPAKA